MGKTVQKMEKKEQGTGNQDFDFGEHGIERFICQSACLDTSSHSYGFWGTGQQWHLIQGNVGKNLKKDEEKKKKEFLGTENIGN